MAVVAVFWLSFLLILYTYAGYPVLLYGVAKVFKKPVHKKPAQPKVSIIISAFNEEKNIENKLHNLLSLDYPKEKLDILIGSDGAWDKTDEIISRFPSQQVRFFRFVKNQGKPTILNALVRESRGSILIFTDVRQEFDKNAIKELVANFEDPQIGCVSGELHFKKAENSAIGEGMGAYWAYEKFLRKKESEIGSMLGATGAIYAVRRKLFKEVPLNMLVDDMYIPLSIIEQGYRAIFDFAAMAYDQPSSKGEQEMKRKIRTLAGNYQIFACFPRLLHPFKSPVAWPLISHKLLRVIAPFFLLLLLAASLLLISHPFYRVILVLQVLFYGLALFETFQPDEKRKGVGYLPYTFCLLNYAAFLGFIQFVRGSKSAAWNKAYE